MAHSVGFLLKWGKAQGTGYKMRSGPYIERRAKVVLGLSTFTWGKP